MSWNLAVYEGMAFLPMTDSDSLEEFIDGGEKGEDLSLVALAMWNSQFCLAF